MKPNKNAEQVAVANPIGAFLRSFYPTITSTFSFTIALSEGLAMLGRSAKNEDDLPFLLFLILAISACSDNTKSEYSDYAEAEANELFDRGWLPPIIPKSSEQISVNNDLDSKDFNR